MTGEPAWNVDPAARGVLLHVESLGHVVSVFRLGGSLLGTFTPCVEMRAVSRAGEVFVARVNDRDGARGLPLRVPAAEMVGAELAE